MRITDLCDGIARCVVSEAAFGAYSLVGPTGTSVRHIAGVAQSLFPQAGRSGGPVSRDGAIVSESDRPGPDAILFDLGGVLMNFAGQFG